MPNEKTFWGEIKERDKKERERVSKIKKGFVWYGLRTLFWTNLVLWLYDTFFLNNEAVSNLLIWFYLILSPPLLILAIIHLNIYKKEALFEVILSLIISGLILLGFLVGLASI